jgi:DNA-binding NarL/FixJ family response regulator
MKVIKVLITGKNTIILQGLEMLLQQESDIEVIEGTDERSLVLENSALKPDIIIVVSSIFDSEELAKTIRNLKKNCPCTRILLFLDENMPDVSLMHYLTRGVDGYIRRSAKGAHVVDAIRSVHAGNIWAERKLLNQFVLCHPLPVADVASRPGSPLTKREKEIVSLLLLGLPNKTLSERLYISEKTVKTHLNNIFKKLKVNSRTQLVISLLYSH